MRNLHSIRATPTPIGDWVNAYFGPNTQNAVDAESSRMQREFLLYQTEAMARTVGGDFRFEGRVRRAQIVFEDLYREASELRRAGLPTRRRRSGLVISLSELRLLQMEMSRNEMQRYFGPEGALPTFMGIPLIVENDNLRDPLYRW